MNYKLLDEKCGKRFIFNKEDLSKLPEKIIQEITCFFHDYDYSQSEASFFIFHVSEYDDFVIKGINSDLKELGFEIIQE
jgi:hypothetical protein